MADGINNKIINNLPNIISGDTSIWVAKLKKALMSFGVSVADNAGNAANVDQVTELTLQEVKDYSGASVSTDILVTFNKDGVKKFKEARVWGRDSATADFALLGTTSTNSYTFKNVESGTTYYIKVVAVDKNGNVSDFGTAPTKSITTSTSFNNPSPPTQLTLTFEHGVPKWQWLASSSPDVTLYDLRENQDPNHGNTGRIGSTIPAVAGQDVYVSNGVPSVSVGTAYLYAFANGLWSEPLVKTFAIAGAVRPNPPRFEITENGFLVLMDDFSEGVVSATVDVSSEYASDTYTSHDNTFQVFGVSGVYTVRYRFNTASTAGEWSDTQQFMLDTTINGSRIIDGTISGAKIAANTITAGQIAANTITAGQIAANTITANNIKGGELTITGGTGDKVTIADGAIDAIKLVANSIASDQIDADSIWAAVVNAGKLSATKIDADNMAANSVTAAKMNVTSLSSITATIGTLRTATTGARVEITDNLISVYDNNNVLRVRMGVWS